MTESSAISEKPLLVVRPPRGLASLNLGADDFGWVTRKLMDLADASAGGRIVSVLEGGYDLQGLKESVAAHVTALMGA